MTHKKKTIVSSPITESASQSYYSSDNDSGTSDVEKYSSDSEDGNSSQNSFVQQFSGPKLDSFILRSDISPSLQRRIIRPYSSPSHLSSSLTGNVQSGGISPLSTTSPTFSYYTSWADGSSPCDIYSKMLERQLAKRQFSVGAQSLGTGLQPSSYNDEEYSLQRHMTTLFGKEAAEATKDKTTRQKAIFEAKRIFSGLTYLLVPGTFGFGPKAAAASALATVLAMCLIAVVLFAALGSLNFFFRVGRVNNLLTVVSINNQLEAPSVVICPPSLGMVQTRSTWDLRNKDVRVRWIQSHNVAVTHTKTTECLSGSLAQCGCIHLWELLFWDGSMLIEQQPVMLFSRGPPTEPISSGEDSLSILIDLGSPQTHQEKETTETTASLFPASDMEASLQKTDLKFIPLQKRIPTDELVRMGLYDSKIRLDWDPLSWMPVMISSETTVALNLERFWDIDIGRWGGWLPMLLLRELRTFRCENNVLNYNLTTDSERLQQEYALPYEKIDLAKTNFGSRGSSKSSIKVHPLVENYLSSMFVQTQSSGLKDQGTSVDIPVLNLGEHHFHWASHELIEAHFEYRSFFTTESFRVGQRMKIVGVMGVIVTVSAMLNYLDLFYAIFPRYRGHVPRLAVSSFVRLITCGMARHNHRSEKIPIPGD